MRFDDVRKCKDAIDTRLEVVRLDMIENILLSLCSQFQVGKHFTQCVSPNRETLAQRSKQGKRCWLGRKCAVFEDCSAKSRSPSQQLYTFAPNGVENHASPFVHRDFLHARDEVFFLSCNHVGRSNLDQRGLLLGCSRGCDADGAFRPHHFNGGNPHAAAGCRDNDEVAFCDLSVCNECSIGCQILHPDGCAFFRGQLLWISRQRTDRNNRYLSIHTVLRHEKRRDSADLLAEPALVDVRPDRRHYTGSLIAEFRGQDGRLQVLTPAEHHLCPVQSNGLYVQTNFAFARLGDWFFLNLQYFRSTQSMETDNFCCFILHVNL